MTSLGSTRFVWICNPSRLTQVALEADKVDLALTYERDNEELAAKEGWSKSAGVLCHDHWVLVGPSSDPARLREIHDPKDALRSIAQHECTFHTRGDGSATMHMEHDLWTAAGIPLTAREKTKWYQRVLGSPLSALREADAQGAYMFVDRATYLFARTQGWALNSSVWIERQPELLNTCVMCIKPDENRDEIIRFVHWLGSEAAQKTIATFGMDKIEGGPWFTPVSQEEVDANGETAPASYLSDANETDALRPTQHAHV